MTRKILNLVQWCMSASYTGLQFDVMRDIKTVNLGSKLMSRCTQDVGCNAQKLHNWSANVPSSSSWLNV